MRPDLGGLGVTVTCSLFVWLRIDALPWPLPGLLISSAVPSSLLLFLRSLSFYFLTAHAVAAAWANGLQIRDGEVVGPVTSLMTTDWLFCPVHIILRSTPHILNSSNLSRTANTVFCISN